MFVGRNGRERDREKGSRGGENQEEVSSEVFSFSLSPWKWRGRVKRNRPRGPPSLRAAPSTRFPQKRPPQGDSRGASLQARSVKPGSGSSPCAGSPTPAAFLFFHREGGGGGAACSKAFFFSSMSSFFHCPFPPPFNAHYPTKKHHTVVVHQEESCSCSDRHQRDGRGVEGVAKNGKRLR